MRKSNWMLLSALVAAALLSYGCVKEEEEKTEPLASTVISFSLTEGGAFDKTGSGNQAETKGFELIADDGSSIPVICETSAMELNLGQTGAEETATKGQRYGSEENFRSETFGIYSWGEAGKIYDGVNVSYSNEKNCWLAETKKYWEYSSMTFAAVYPKDGCTFSGIAKDNLDFTYTTKASAADQKDLMLAYYSGKGDNGAVPLSFTHALTCVNFSTGTLDGAESIDEISLEGVYAEGTCAVTEAATPTYTWTPSGSTTVTSSGTVAKADFKDLESKAGYNFLLVPQDLGTQNVTLKVTMTINGTQMTFKKKIDGKVIDEWKVGKKCTVNLGYCGDISISVDDNATGNTKDNLSICNTGKVSAYFRVALVGDWRTEQGIIMSGWDESQGTFTDFPGTNWEKIGDYYYYKNPVDEAENESTPTKITNLLFSKYVAPSTPPVEGTVLNLNVSVQAVKYDQEKVMVAEAWGDDVAAKLNTK